MDEGEELDEEEARILDLLAWGLSREFPNSERGGCSSSAVLRGIAFRKLRLAEIQQWLDHLRRAWYGSQPGSTMLLALLEQLY